MNCNISPQELHTSKKNRSITAQVHKIFRKILLSKLQRLKLSSNTKPSQAERFKPREKPASVLGTNPKKLLKGRYFTEDIQNKTPRIRNLASKNKKSSRHKQRILPVIACFLLPLVLESLRSKVHHNNPTACNECLWLWLCYTVLGDLRPQL